MTTIADHAPAHTRGPAATHLIRAEYLKIRTTNTWWIFGLGTIGFTALALLVNMLQAHYYLKGAVPEDADERAQWLLQHNPITQAANIYTSGQFFGGMFVMVLAILMITNEYYHQTATSTFLTTPHRTSVVLAKFVTAMLASAFFWVLTTVLDLLAGSIFFNAEKFSSSYLGEWPVQRAILINLAVFALWAVFGVGIGVLIRSQIGATVTATLLYVVGTQVAAIITFLIHQFWIKKDWVLTMQVLVPARAAEIAVSPTKLYPQSPPEWVGAVVLIGYGVLLGLIGTSIMRNRDIS